MPAPAPVIAASDIPNVGTATFRGTITTSITDKGRIAAALSTEGFVDPRHAAA